DINGLGVASTHYTTDGTDPTLSSPTYTAAFPVNTTTTVKFRSWDNAGNIEATQSQAVLVDQTAPVTTITCNGAACQTGGYTATVTVALSATDAAGGSGVSSTHYTTDGTDPTLASPTYTQPFAVNTASTVQFRSWDKAGNVEATQSQVVTVTVDATAPTTTIACNGVACGTGPYAPGVAVTLTSTDNTGGSGVASTRYTLDGTDPTTSSTLYTAAVPLSATTTVKYRSWDVAGNAEVTKSQLVSVDNAAPVTSMLCNGNPCV
ncbi:chitobiase/beta-hexosaminidase C-terminal domain-containing protein, partial [Pedococcus ginsenosidimutans]|uniref:chitobiase/beta-hexosaminidase C-terminal domain-containing protein n=1 Tax=Pedococcus ginsenosidimutans TaxID=490570 RepID=UPI0031EC75CA